MGYFTVEVKPTITASKQAAFANKDVLFDWTSFQVPRGANKLVSVTAIFRGTNGAIQTARDMDLFFAKSISGTAPVTLGAINATTTAAPITTNHLLGMAHIDTADYGQSGWDYINIAQTGSGAAASLIPNMVLEGDPNSGDNVGYDTLYLGGIAGGAFDFGTTVLVSNAIAADNTTVIPTQATSDGDDDPNAELKFAVGDVIHSATDDELGTIASIASFSTAQNITLTANNVDAIADNEEIFNVNPIRIILSFEK